MPVNDTEAPWDAVAYVRASTRRRSVFESLAESPKSATEIAEELGIGRQTVSQHIGQLRSGNDMGEDHDLVVCLTEERQNYRIYALTAKGEDVKELL
jgi:predicted ArsR family transcriptional regulator